VLHGDITTLTSTPLQTKIQVIDDLLRNFIPAAALFLVTVLLPNITEGTWRGAENCSAALTKDIRNYLGNI
jgi:hypothetical protein